MQLSQTEGEASDGRGRVGDVELRVMKSRQRHRTLASTQISRSTFTTSAAARRTRRFLETMIAGTCPPLGIAEASVGVAKEDERERGSPGAVLCATLLAEFPEAACRSS